MRILMLFLGMLLYMNTVGIADCEIHQSTNFNIIDLHGVTSELNSTLIYSVTGNVLYSSRSNSETIDISNLSVGIYFLELSTSEGNTQIQKFIKN